MEEADFSIHKEIESLDPGYEENLDHIVSKYKNTSAPAGAPSSASDPLLKRLVEHSQIRDLVTGFSKNKEGSGISLSVSNEALRWLLMVILVIFVIWVLYKVLVAKYAPPSEERYLGSKKMRMLEKKIKSISQKQQQLKQIKEPNIDL